VSGPKYVNGKEVGPRKKPPTAEELNKRAREQWKIWNGQIDKFVKKHPERAGRIAQRAGRLVQQGHISNPELAPETSVTGAIIDDVELLGADASGRAQKPRKARNSHRNEVINAMRAARRRGDSLQHFLDSVKVDSTDGVKIARVISKTEDKYDIESDAPGDGPRVPFRTLESWWTAALGMKSSAR
jgi:hypothetical protein